MLPPRESGGGGGDKGSDFADGMGASAYSAAGVSKGRATGRCAWAGTRGGGVAGMPGGKDPARACCIVKDEDALCTLFAVV